MTDVEDTFIRFKRIGTAGLVCNIAGFALTLITYVTQYILALSLQILPVIPSLRTTLLVISVIALVAGLVLEFVSAQKCALSKGKMFAGLFLWVMGAVFCTIMIRILFS